MMIQGLQPISLAAIAKNTCSVYIIIIVKLCFIVKTPHNI
jgi:hypothetical protein